MSEGKAKMASCMVVGAGVFGAWTAYHLRRTGHEVTLLDCYGPGNNRSSSGGETRIIRASYGKDELYTRMAVRSFALWDSFFGRIGRSLLHRTGVLWIAKEESQYAAESRKILDRVGVPFEEISPSELTCRYPQMNYEARAIFEPGAGALMARQCVQHVVAQFVSDGGTFRPALVRPPAGSGHFSKLITATGEALIADVFVFACGPWLPKVFPEILGQRIFPTKQEVFFFGVPPDDRRFAPPQMPVWIDFDDNRGMYGFPDLDGRGFKVAIDRHGPPFDPDIDSRLPGDEAVSIAREYLAEHFPALANSPIVESRVCQYENTSNGDFLLDRHPAFDNVWIAGGGSGHGFKHGPAVGEYVAAQIIGNREPSVEPRFSFTSKQTEQHRTVY
jgi:glycine/D-amino acid oxidase-like deaminating enzyme